MTTIFRDKPLLRPTRVTRGNIDELLHRISREFTPARNTLTTEYPVPGRRRNETSSHVSVSAATLDEIIDHPDIARVVTSTTNVELTELTISAEDGPRKVHIAITQHGVTADIQGPDDDWVQGRSREVRLVLDNPHPSWALWRASRHRGFLALGAALDLAAYATTRTAGLELRHTPLAAVLTILALVLIPAATALIGGCLTHRCHVRIGKHDPSWFWQRWTTNERLAFASLLLALITWTTGLFTNTTNNEGQPPPPASTHSSNGR
ncbi:hypothetical protein ACJWDR_00205 [Streptomyces tauricus]|uniref:hypothetical protein n=1 Tax=Streptomyces tauricus TaxID=68274 RepID=UPI00387F2BFF